MRRLVVSSLLLAIGLVSPVCAQPGPQSKSQSPSGFPASDVTAVNGCVREVRESNSNPSRFDAHISLRGKIRSAGTEDQMLLFRECMQKKGQPVDLESH